MLRIGTDRVVLNFNTPCYTYQHVFRIDTFAVPLPDYTVRWRNLADDAAYSTYQYGAAYQYETVVPALVMLDVERAKSSPHLTDPSV